MLHKYMFFFIIVFLVGLILISVIGCNSANKRANKRASVHDSSLLNTPLPQMIGAADPFIQYTGRIDFSDSEAPSFSFPGVMITAEFQGSGIDVRMSDNGQRNYFNVFIDGNDPVVIQSSGKSQTYMIARNLDDSVHTICIYKRTESNCGVAVFEGFNLDAGKSLVKPAAFLERRLEFIGDSITCGYGNMVSAMSPENFHFTPVNENSYLSWGANTARSLDARFVSTSYSGRGLFRNFDGSESGVLPQIFGTIYADSPSRAAWDFSTYIPDVVVINLGTNDYSSQLAKKDLNEEQFDARFSMEYSNFIKTIQMKYGPDVKIICCVGPQMSDSYPPGSNSWSRIQNTLSALVENLNAEGYIHVYYFRLTPQSSPFGEDWHPTADTHKKMSEEIVPLIRKVTNWQ